MTKRIYPPFIWSLNRPEHLNVITRLAGKGCFEHMDDAERVRGVLNKRFEKYHLSLHPDKIIYIRFEHNFRSQTPTGGCPLINGELARTLRKDKVIDLKKPEQLIDDPNSVILRNGVRRFFAQALETKIENFTNQYSDLSDDPGRKRIMRNCYTPEREIQSDIDPACLTV